MHLDWKTLIGVTVYVGFGIAGQLVLGHAMKQMPPFTGLNLGEVGRFFRYVGTTPQVLVGIALLAINFGMLLALLSWANVSVIIPTSALSYVLLAFLARVFLSEQIPAQRWVGVVLISVGVALVLTSRSASHGPGDPPPRSPPAPAAAGGTPR